MANLPEKIREILEDTIPNQREERRMILKEQLEEILEEYRKTCFLVASDTTNDKAVQLMAMTIITTKQALLHLFADYAESIVPEEWTPMKHLAPDRDVRAEGFNQARQEILTAINKAREE